MSTVSPLVASLVLTLSIGACDTPSAPPVNPHMHSANGTRVVGSSLPTAEVNKQLAALRAATAKYQNVAGARADGYVDDGFGCIEDPELGGMGWHLINDALHADPAVDPARPDLLVYEVQKNGGLKLVALEYEVFQSDWWNAGYNELPVIAGHTFMPLIYPGLDPVFEAHVWVWKPNPSGMFEDWNPATSCP